MGMSRDPKLLGLFGRGRLSGSDGCGGTFPNQGKPEGHVGK